MRRNRPSRQISPACGLPREANFSFLAVLRCAAASLLCFAMRRARTPALTDHAKAAMVATWFNTKGLSIMSHIGTFNAQGNGFTGTVRTLTLNVKVKFVPNNKESENAPDYRIQAGGNYDIGAAWKKLTKAEQRPYLSVSLDDPSFPGTIHARLVEGEEGVHNLIWTRNKND
jgi:uncharacterized protein (DUF736 family)